MSWDLKVKFFFQKNVQRIEKLCTFIPFMDSIYYVMC